MSHIDKDKYHDDNSDVTEEMKQLESFNIISDMNIFSKAYYALDSELDNLSQTETDKDTLVTKASLAQIDYMNKIYKLAVTRLKIDAKGLYYDSQEYLSYIALLQTYADAFTEDKDALLKETNVLADSFENYKSVSALSILEDYFLELLYRYEKQELAK